MPAEIFWDFVGEASHRPFDEVTRIVRFRRPQLINPLDIAEVFSRMLAYYQEPHPSPGVEMMEAVLKGNEGKIIQGVEQGIITPVGASDHNFACLIQFLPEWSGWSRAVVLDTEQVTQEENEQPWPLLPGESVLSTRRVHSFPLRIVPSDVLGESFLRVVHNIPQVEQLVMGACTWMIYTQPLTSIELVLSDAWLSEERKGDKDGEVFNIAQELYWGVFPDWVNHGVLVRALTNKGYDLTPQFDPAWTESVVENQCQACGSIYSTLPHKLSDVQVGQVSTGWCNCPEERDQADSFGRVERSFEIIGAYPISPQEAEHARCEVMLQADSID